MDVIVVQSTPIFIFLYPQQSTVLEGTGALCKPSAAFIHIKVSNFSVDAQKYVTISIAEPVLFLIDLKAPSVSLYTARNISTERRLHRSAWQARLGSRLDPIKRKLLDNNILLTAHPTDMLRIRVERDPRTYDILSRKIIPAEILPIVLPVMSDIPMRRLEKNNDTGMIVCSFSMIEEQKPFELYCPVAGQLQRDDLLFRILKDPYADFPYIMVLQVKDELATFSYSSILYVKYKATFYDEPLPVAVVQELVKASEKREQLAW